MDRQSSLLNITKLRGAAGSASPRSCVQPSSSLATADSSLCFPADGFRNGMVHLGGGRGPCLTSSALRGKYEYKGPRLGWEERHSGQRGS